MLQKNIKDYTVKEEAEKKGLMAEKHNGNIKNIVNDVNTEKETLKQEFNSALNKIYFPKGEAINEKDVLLLNSGVILTASEIEELARKHTNNTTMLRIIETYANNRKLELATEITDLFKQAKTAGEAEKQAFAEFENVADKCIGLMMYCSTSKDVLEKSINNIEKYSGIVLEKVIAYEAGTQSNI